MDDIVGDIVVEQPSALFGSSLPIEVKLDRARTELLDLSARNRLLNVPRYSKTSRTIEIIDEKTAEIYRLLVKEGRSFTFVPGRVVQKAGSEEQGDEELDAEELADLSQPDDEADEKGVFSRHVDTKLQTRLTSVTLQKKLLDFYLDARTLEEEQGINILFLALGTLKWVDPNNAKNIRYAPLILVPVVLERGSAKDRFKLKARTEDIIANLSLETFLERVHALRLPIFTDGEDFDPASYLQAVSETISLKPGWSVQPDDIILGFFSFAKFLMYVDLDPKAWPAGGSIVDRPLIRSLMAEGFPSQDHLVPEGGFIDDHISPREMLHIVDSDSSQSLAIYDARANRNLVIQGPPGTGKSQTIANIIASAVADGKTVLFVAEKMAALSVVKNRLDQAGVGDTCLELHSHKANKRSVLDELRRTWDLGSPRGDFSTNVVTKLQAVRDDLNGHSSRMHAVHAPSQYSPYQVIGHLTQLRRAGWEPTEYKLPDAPQWSPDDRQLRSKLLDELAQRIADIGLPSEHPWRGVALNSVLPTEVERLARRMRDLQTQLKQLMLEQEISADRVSIDHCSTLAEFFNVAALAERLKDTPALPREALASPVWDTKILDLDNLLESGVKFSGIKTQLNDIVAASAWTASLAEANFLVKNLPGSLAADFFAALRRLSQLLPGLQSEAEHLRLKLGLTDPGGSLAAIDQTIVTGERVAAAPDASPEAFVASVWEQGVEQAAELAESVAALEKVRAEVDPYVAPAAWTTDLSEARRTLASKGSGFMRHLDGQWRSANRLVKSVFKTPELPALETLIAVLDNLAEGQRAAAQIKEKDEFGRAAFGGDWRGDRSVSAPLGSLVAWMRSLKGLGAEPRLIAGRLPDRAEIGERAARLKRLVADVSPILEWVWNQLAGATNCVFGDAFSSERSNLSEVLRHAQALALAEGVCRATLMNPRDHLADNLAVVKVVMVGQSLAAVLKEGDELGKAAFGDKWHQAESNWSELLSVATWIKGNLDIRVLAAKVDEPRFVKAITDSILRKGDKLVVELDELFGDLRTTTTNLFEEADIRQVPLSAVDQKLELWLQNTEQLSKWVSYQDRAKVGRLQGLSEFIAHLENGRLTTASILPTFEITYFDTLFAAQIQDAPEIGRFDGELHGRLVKEFRELDLERIAGARIEVVRAHHRRIPPPVGGVGPLGILRGEIARRRGHMPIRQLLEKAGPAVQALKPVIMMSPLSVAQFLAPGKLSFDLLVMDEASQIQPVDALGAIARCNQVVVVGDERQLPPTRFFSKMVGSSSDAEDEDDGAQVADIESILGLFTARGLPQRMLRWHYRSRHQSLIAVSNSEFYENKLFIVPSPYTNEGNMGLRFHYIANGVFDTGNTGINLEEAKTVAEAIIRHAKTTPALSLGVATFSMKQRRAIQDQLEILRRLNPDTEEFFHAHPHEQFFVKNLENVQGDERDVIFISVGYGKNAQGYMAMRFGPLGAEGGERRLNVLISRAKRRCEVFSSITEDDIDLERAKGKGVVALKLYLHFARTGSLAIGRTTGRDPDSVFEEQVASALQDLDFKIHPQVGLAGFFIDLAVVDPERPGRYLLGIECDGAAYHSARSARDRDRLRQAVLEDHGWIIHRVWSTDWFQRPQEQLARVVAAIGTAKEELDARLQRDVEQFSGAKLEIVTIDREVVTEVGLESRSGVGRVSTNYVEANPPRPIGTWALHETPTGILAELVVQVIAVESPVHIDEVVTRIRGIWGLQRAGGRIQATVERAIEFALEARRIIRDGPWLSAPDAELKVRDRSNVISSSLRKIEMLPPAETKVAIVEIVRQNFGASRDEIIQNVSRLYGYKATSVQLRDMIDMLIDFVGVTGTIVKQGEIFVIDSK